MIGREACNRKIEKSHLPLRGEYALLLLFEDLFINLSVLIALIFIYLQLRNRIGLETMPAKKAIAIDGFAGGLLGLLLMYFSIQVGTETIVDLRFIPVMLLLIFLGPPQAMLSAVLIILGRFLLGVNTSALAATILMVILIIGFLAIRKFFSSRQQRATPYQMGFVMIIFSNIVFSIIITVLIQDPVILRDLLPSYWLVSIVGGITAIFFVEYIRKTQYLLMKYEQESTTDFLTGLNNVRQFDAIWNELIRSAVEKDEKLSLLIVDIDHFKTVNDTYGHPVGDKILIELGKVLKSASRSVDIVSRNGGEEFSVILPDCPHEKAIVIAENIRKAVENHKFRVSPSHSISITISIGVATYPETVADTAHIVEKADEYLYRAKRTGRNKVCASY